MMRSSYKARGFCRPVTPTPPPPATYRRVVLRLLLSEDDTLLREGLIRLLGGGSDLEVVGAVGDLPSLLAAIDDLTPDVVLTDIRMPPSNTDEGIRAARGLRASHPDLGVVVLSQFLEPAYALTLFEDGSDRRAYLLKERVSEVEELVDAVCRVAEGGSVVDPKVVEALVAGASPRRDSDLDQLTPRETEILREMATGKTNAAIGRALVLSERAVEKHTNAIFSKLGLSEEPDVNRRVKAVLLYLAERGTAPDGVRPAT